MKLKNKIPIITMKYQVAHETRYTFDAEIYLEPHILRFKPKITPHTNLSNFSLEILPEPMGISEHFDEENNLVHLCWFEGFHNKLVIKAESEVDCYPFNPFNFIGQTIAKYFI